MEQNNVVGGKKETDILEFDKISLPISCTVDHDVKNNKYIYIFGDYHFSAENRCNPCEKGDCILIVNLLKELFTKTDIPIDFYMESPFYYKNEKNLAKVLSSKFYVSKGTPFTEIISSFKNCLIPNKAAMCKKKYPNVRMHYTDFRLGVDDISNVLFSMYVFASLMQNSFETFETQFLRVNQASHLAELFKILFATNDGVGKLFATFCYSENFESDIRNMFGDKLCDRLFTFDGVSEYKIRNKKVSAHKIKKQMDKNDNQHLKNIMDDFIAYQINLFSKKYNKKYKDIYKFFNETEYVRLIESKKFQKNKANYKKIFDMFVDYLIEFNATIVDLYTVARMLKFYDRSKIIISYAGDYHSDNYRILLDIFRKNGVDIKNLFTKKESYEVGGIITNQEPNRCITGPIYFPLTNAGLDKVSEKMLVQSVMFGGGTFSFKHISDPVSFSQQSVDNKQIYIFGDEHFSTRNDCNPCQKGKCIRLVDLLELLFTKSEKKIDFFLETPFVKKDSDISHIFEQETRIGAHLGECMDRFGKCLVSKKSKSCKIYKNTRMHYIDLRFGHESVMPFESLMSIFDIMKKDFVDAAKMIDTNPDQHTEFNIRDPELFNYHKKYAELIEPGYYMDFCRKILANKKTFISFIRLFYTSEDFYNDVEDVLGHDLCPKIYPKTIESKFILNGKTFKSNKIKKQIEKISNKEHKTAIIDYIEDIFEDFFASFDFGKLSTVWKYLDIDYHQGMIDNMDYHKKIAHFKNIAGLFEDISYLLLDTSVYLVDAYALARMLGFYDKTDYIIAFCGDMHANTYRTFFRKYLDAKYIHNIKEGIIYKKATEEKTEYYNRCMVYDQNNAANKSEIEFQF